MAFLATLAAPAMGSIAGAWLEMIGAGAKSLFSNFSKKVKFDELKDKTIEAVAENVNQIGNAVISNGKIRQDYTEKILNYGQRAIALVTMDKEAAKKAAKDGERIQVLSKADWLTEQATQQLEGSDDLKKRKGLYGWLVKPGQQLEENG